MSQRAQASLHIRLPPSLHDHLRDKAIQENMSLNALVVALLAGGTGWKLEASR